MQTISLFDQSVTVNQAVVPQLKEVEECWRQKGGHDFYRVHTLYGYAHRKIAGTNTLSQHAHGWALDVNPQQNPMGDRLVTDMPAGFVNCWKQQGFGWGGEWSSKKDAMHFSLAKHEGGVGVGNLGTPAPGGQTFDVGDGQEPTTKRMQAGGEGEVVVNIAGTEQRITADTIRSVYETFMGRRPEGWEKERWLGKPQEELDEFERAMHGAEESKAFTAAQVYEAFAGRAGSI